MLDINEYNKLLYRQLDRKAEEKSMISDYGRYLQHSKSKETESGIELQAATWLANFRGLTTSNGFLKTPQGMKEICEGLIPQASKLLRKANKKGAPEETKAELRNARKFLEDCLADANAALEHSDEDPNHLIHGEKWRKHKYIRIENGRYIYPEDLKKSSSLQNIGAAIGANKKPAVKSAGPQGPVATGTVKQKAPGLGVKEYANVQAVKYDGKAEATKKEGPIQKRTREEVARDDVLKKVSESKEIDDYAKEIAAAYEKGLIKFKKDGSADFDTTKEWKDNAEYDTLLNAANKAEEYCKKLAEESNGATDWWDIRKELEERILRPVVDKHIKDNTEEKKYQDSVRNWRNNRDATRYSAEDRAQKMKANGLKHSDSSDSMAATAMSKDEYEELLKKVESLT